MNNMNTMNTINTKEKILFEARKIFILKGYHDSSVQNIIDEVGIAKGTFYHHFKSKEELLTEMLNISMKQSLDIICSKIENDTLKAIDKLNLFLSLSIEYKQANVDELLIYLKSLYSSNNYFYRLKMNELVLEHYSKLLNDIIDEGVKEGVFDTNHPLELGKLILKLSSLYGEELSKIILHPCNYKDPLLALKSHADLFMESLEKLLGIKEGTLITLNIEPFKNLLSKGVDMNDTSK